MLRLKSLFFTLLTTIIVLSGYAQAPAGYYDSAKGKKQKALLQELCDIIGPHTSIGYDGLWEAYRTTDVHPGTNQIWDMYSTATFYVDQKKCGNYKNVGDCYNREHSFPKSWFDDAQPMYCDVFHIYPTDGKVNGQRSNYPYGECANGTSLSNGNIKGLGKLGKSTFPGYSGTVFEPDDEYKGDFARSYFYMAACYNDRISSWNSDMLAHNNYPCYTTWAVNLLLKWHRQDPVSQKEIDRNNAAYKLQHNRNPFIDYPELAEYIWGDKQDLGWIPGGVVTPELVKPADGSTYDMGVTSISGTLTYKIDVKATNLSKPLTVSISGNGFSVSPTSISADEANNGTAVTVTYRPSAPALLSAPLTLSSSEVSATVTVKAQAVDGIPALPATNVTPDAFNANWTDIHKDGGNYSLSVFLADGTTLLPGYPKNVPAASETARVEGLDSEAVYKYQLSRDSEKSNVVSVTTASPVREISATLPEGGLNFSAKPNEASMPLAVEIYSQYVEEDINVTISGNFEISTDKSNWKQALTIDRDGERIYVRMKAAKEGAYSGVLSANTPTVTGFDADVKGVVSAPRTFFEDFEQGTPVNNYSLTEYEGTACSWSMLNAGTCNRSGDKFNGKQSICLGKSGDRWLAMAENKTNGAGTLSFMAATFNDDEDSVIEVFYSVNDGQSWISLGDVTATSLRLEEFTMPVEIAQPVRFKFVCTAGKRVNIDDVAITDYDMGSVNATELNAGWDAFNRDGKLRIEVSQPSKISVYTLDAATVFERIVPANTSISLPQGVYIVVNGNDSRKVIIK